MEKQKTPKNVEKKSLLLDAARTLFLEEGLQPVSMNKVTRAAGISKRTVYKLFPGRDELLAAAVAYDFEAWQEWFFDAIRERVGNERDSMDAFYEILRTWADTPGYRGCLFARVLLTRDAVPEAVHAAATSCLTRLHHFLKGQSRKAGCGDPAAFIRIHLVYLLMFLGGNMNTPGIASHKQLLLDLQAITKHL